ncbi:MAG TPA: long-chain fatty acid--CoA ligase [Chitinophagales bacterium]|nr:long-chain fatty acid--CoA ligase [Chitinophagales bacterium]
MLNLSTILESTAIKFPKNKAFTLGDLSLNYAQINALANQVANGLKSIGIQKGDKVALTCPNVPYFPMIYFGILKAGATVVPLSVLLKKDEVAYHLKDSDAKAYFCFIGTPDIPMAQNGLSGFNEVDTCENFYVIMPQNDQASLLPNQKTFGEFLKDQSPAFDTVQTSAEDTAVIIYTSGTTGKPKGAELTHNSIFTNTVVSSDILDTESQPVTQLLVLPLFHIFAMTVLMNSGVYKGAHNVLLPRFDAEQAFQLIDKHQIGIFAGVPTMYWALLHHKTELDTLTIAKNLKLCVSGGASLPIKVLEDFESKFNVPIIEGYGMSEGSPVVTFNQLDVGRKPGSVGTPVWGCEVKIVDENDNEVAVGEKGELVYRGPNVMKGYYNKPEANAVTLKNGWLHSGDIAIKDEDGFFFIVDRTKDMIIRGGFNVYPREIEEVMLQHPAISLVAIIGVPHEQHGEEIKAFVVLKADQKAEVDEIKAWTKERVANYKYPRIIELVEGLPMSATGKILKKELR